MLIYQSESKGPYVTGCFVLGSVCVLYSVVNGQTILFDPLVEPSYFVKATFGLVCSAMLGFGAAFFYKVYLSAVRQEQKAYSKADIPHRTVHHRRPNCPQQRPTHD